MTISEIRGLYKATSHEEVLKAYGEVDVNATNPHSSDESMLHIACSMADADAVAMLLARGLSPNTRNRYGQAPLFTLASLDDRYQPFPEAEVRRCADLLLDAGANVIRKDDDLGHTPITMAGKHGRFELLQSAVEHGVKISGTDRDGNNALHLACQFIRHELSALEYARGDEEVANTNRRIDQFYKSAQALLDGGLDWDEKNDRSQSALDLAIESGASKIAVLFKGGDPDDENSLEAKTGGMDLLQAVINNNLDSIRANVELGADLNSSADDGDFKGMTPLAVACYMLELPTVQHLLKLGANPNFKDANGRTAIARWFMHLGDFHLDMKKAIDAVPVQILKALIASGMDKNETVNDQSDTPLLGACRVADTGRFYNDFRMGRAVAEASIAAGCDPNRSNLDGVTPLMLLCGKAGDGIGSLAADLLDAGADLTAVDKNGNTALHYAARNGSANMGKELAELLFDYGFTQTEAVNNEGKSALEIAADKGNEPLVKLILMNS